MAPGAVLIIVAGGGEGWPLRALLDELHKEPSISLIGGQGMALERGLEKIAGSPGITVVLVIGTERELRAAVDQLRKARPNLHILAVAMENGTATLSLRDTLAEEIVAVVRSLTERADGDAGGEDASRTGQILRFSARAEDGRRAAARNLPSTIAPCHADPGLLSTLATAIAWVDAATRGLVEIWSAKGEDVSGFAPSRDTLESWLLRLVGLVDAPAETAERRFREFMRMVDHQSVAHTPIVRVAELLGRDPLSLKLFLIVLAAELDIRFHRLFGSLHDDLGRRQPSVALACAIIAAATAKATPSDIRAQIAGLDRLRRMRLIEGVGETIGSAEEPLRINLQLLAWLLTGDGTRLLAAPDVAEMATIAPDAAAALVSADRQRTLKVAFTRGLSPYGDRAEITAVILTGSEPGWLETEAAILAEPEIRVRPPAVPLAPEVMEAALGSIALAASLTGRHLVVESGVGAESYALWRAFDALLPDFAGPAFAVTDDAAALLTLLPERRIAVVTLPPPAFADRRAAVEAAIGTAEEEESGEDARLAETIAHRFRLPIRRFADALSLSRAAAARDNRAEPCPADWLAGFRAAAGAGIPSLVRLVEPRPCPNDKPYSCLDRVVLPGAERGLLEGLVEHVAHGRTVLDEWGFGALLDAHGVAALFSGPSGTGKTLAAHAVASQLASDLYVVDLAKIVSKYLGETEKQLDTLFGGATRAGAVLLFDEADALFGRRTEVKDAHDRFANIEVAYLLQRMEAFPGLCILTTNHPENIDPAFARRFRFQIAFPRPDAASRLRIWEQSIPAGPRRDERLEFEFYARRFEVTGGSIRQIALHAAVAAARGSGRIGKAEVEAAIRTELMRLGNYADLAQLEPRAA